MADCKQPFYLNQNMFCFNFLYISYLKFQACYARVLDYRRKFIEAAVRYNELSYKTMIADDERMTALKNAMIGTILASAGMPFMTFVVLL